ncbi:MAG: hypothetical protein KDD37_01025 [Bdellovibrionales bacterium]|nr:hypothetical protein [Bdellovibrionales bacterium]
MFFKVSNISHAWEVFMLFMVPVGGGIPAGVILAKARGISWFFTAGIYLISDLVLACLFEPIMLLMVFLFKRFSFFNKLREAFRKTTEKTVAMYGATPGVMLLVLIAFGVDPMTGRAAAMSRGYNFLAGWAIAITGDMLYFLVIMASTLWLSHILGDGTWAVIIIMVFMLIVPSAFRRIKTKLSKDNPKSL